MRSRFACDLRTFHHTALAAEYCAPLVLDRSRVSSAYNMKFGQDKYESRTHPLYIGIYTITYKIIRLLKSRQKPSIAYRPTYDQMHDLGTRTSTIQKEPSIVHSKGEGWTAQGTILSAPLLGIRRGLLPRRVSVLKVLQQRAQTQPAQLSSAPGESNSQQQCSANQQFT